MAEIDPTRAARPTFSGLASGLDTGALVDSLIQFERRPLTLIERRRDEIKAGQEAVRKLNTLVLDLRNAAREIDNRSSSLGSRSSSDELLRYTATSANESVLKTEVGSGAAPGSHRVHVDALASVARRVSASFAATDTLVGAGSFDIVYGGAADIQLSLDASTTLSQLRDAINGDANNDGSVRADLISDGSGHRLVVSGTRTGVANDVAVATSLSGPASAPFIDPALGGSASDASLSYLGLTVTRASNDVSDLIPGVTLKLSSTNAIGEEVEIDVARDDEAVVAKVQKLVDAFNALRGFAADQADASEERKGGPLSGDSLLQTIESRVRRVLGSAVSFGDPASDPRSASAIGIRFKRDGGLELDAGVLKSALAKNPEAVKRLFSGSEPIGDEANDGIATALARALNPILDTTIDPLTGKPRPSFFAARTQGVNDRLRSIEGQISRFEQRLEKREEYLRRQFANLETLVASLQSQSSFLNRI